jgi:hypothetical protein
MTQGSMKRKEIIFLWTSSGDKNGVERDIWVLMWWGERFLNNTLRRIRMKSDGGGGGGPFTNFSL